MADAGGRDAGAREGETPAADTGQRGVPDAGGAQGAAGQAADEPRVVARLVHDLRSPLTIVEGFAHLLERDAERLDVEQRAAYAQRIKAAAADMRELLDAVR